MFFSQVARNCLKYQRGWDLQKELFIQKHCLLQFSSCLDFIFSFTALVVLSWIVVWGSSGIPWTECLQSLVHVHSLHPLAIYRVSWSRLTSHLALNANRLKSGKLFHEFVLCIWPQSDVWSGELKSLKMHIMSEVSPEHRVFFSAALLLLRLTVCLCRHSHCQQNRGRFHLSQ